MCLARKEEVHRNKDQRDSFRIIEAVLLCSACFPSERERRTDTCYTHLAAMINIGLLPEYDLGTTPCMSNEFELGALTEHLCTSSGRV